jgi:cytochrome c oxidase assembly factor CtaG
LLWAWDVNHVVVWLLPIVALVYLRGFILVRRQLPARYPLWRLVSFMSGLSVVLIAVASPIHPLGELLLAIHMSQHMLLTMAAPPLLWMGQPLVPIVRALPSGVARLLRPLSTASLVHRIGRACAHPAVGWTALSAAIVVWHLPRCYELAVHSEFWHDVQHACFFSGALLFWLPVVEVWPIRITWPRWAIIPYLVSADLVNTAQSAILTFSTHALYPSYAAGSRLFGLSPLDDQALAGVIMWVPGSIAFLVPAIALTVRLLEHRPYRPTQPGKPRSALARPTS